MEEYELKHISDYHCNLTFLKETTKKNGEVKLERGDTLYGIRNQDAINYIAHYFTVKSFKDKDVSLREYLTAFYKNYEDSRKRFYN